MDIDVHKHSETEIREARDYAEAIVRTMRDPLLILNGDLRVHAANEAFYHTFQISPGEAEGRLIYELADHQWNIPRLRELLEEILPRNSFFNNFEVTHDFQTIGQRTLLLNARALSDKSGQPTRILLGIQNVTELLHLQAAMQRSEVRYRRLFEAARDGVLLIDPQTRKILDANPFMIKLLGYTRDELLGRELFDIGLLKDEEASRVAFRELKEKGFIRYEDLPLEAKTGERREVEFVSNLYDEDGETIVQCNIRDITDRKREENELRESQTRYQALVQASAQIVWTTDANGAVVEDSPSWRAFTGQTYEQWKGFGWLDVFHPDDRERVSEQWQRTVAERSPLEIEYRIRHTSGDWRWTTARAVPVLNADGTVREWVGMNSDITERRQAEVLVDCHRQALQLLAEGAPLAEVLEFLIGVVERNSAEGMLASIVPLNEAGTHFQRGIGASLPEGFNAAVEGVEVSSLSGICCHAVSRGGPVAVGDFNEGTEWQAFAQFVAPYGLCSGWSTPIISSSGQMLATFANYYRHAGDPTPRNRQLVDVVLRTAAAAIERKRAEEALRESEERYRTLFAAAPMAIFVCDRNAVIQYYNHRATELWGREPVCGVEQHCGSVKLWLPGDTLLPHAQSPIVEVLRTGVPALNMEVFIERPDGSRLPVLVNFAALKNTRGEITGAITSFIDITERRKAEEERERLLHSEQQARQEAENANRVKDEFLATVSHELRTPLNAMMGWADMLNRGGLDEPTAVHAAETIARNARAQNQLISDLLDVSRIISGKLRLEMAAVELIPVIEAAMDTVRTAADARGVELWLHADPTVGLVSGDSGRLQQVVWNLLSNAIKYSPRGGRVDVRLERDGTNVAIIVRDTGEGIRPEFLPYIFDRFRQADSATTRLHGGLGLGLAIVRSLVEAQGGTVHADSGGAGQGATFTVTLPLIAVRRVEGDAQTKDAGETISCQSPSHKNLNGVRVLVIDDDLDARELLSLALTLDGAEVRAGATAREALQILDQWKPDVLVSDVGMPGEDGYDLIRKVRVREKERSSLIPALGLTGYASDEDATRARKAGFQMHLPKPVEHARLTAAVSSLARSRRDRPQDSKLIAEEIKGSGSHNS